MLGWEPVSGIEPLTCRLQEACWGAPEALPARMGHGHARNAQTAPVFRRHAFHDPFHASLSSSVTERSRHRHVKMHQPGVTGDVYASWAGVELNIGPAAWLRLASANFAADGMGQSAELSSAKVGHAVRLTLIIVMIRCVVDGQAELMMAEAAEACRLQDHLCAP